jgi:transposase-like protein
MTNVLTTGAERQSAAKPRTRVNWTAAERAEWLQLFSKSGQTVSEFCRANDLPPATLSLWRQQQAGANAQDGRLVEIPVSALPVAAASRPAAVSVRLPTGVKLQIVPGTDLTWLGALLNVLMSAGT